MSHQWETTSPEETRGLATEILDLMGGAGMLLLEGDLGAGKTCLVQGMAQALGIQGPVTSPTYSLVKTYGDPTMLVHGDLYRLTDEDELFELGLEEWLEGNVVFAVEWPSRAPELWRPEDWRLSLETVPEHPDLRRIRMWKGEGA